MMQCDYGNQRARSNIFIFNGALVSTNLSLLIPWPIDSKFNSMFLQYFKSYDSRVCFGSSESSGVINTI